MKNCVSIGFLVLCGLVIALGNVQASPWGHSGNDSAHWNGPSISVISNKPVGEEVVVNNPEQSSGTGEGQNETSAGEVSGENRDSFEPVCEENCESCGEPTCDSCREDCGMTCCRHRHCWGRRYWHRMTRTSCACDCETWTSTWTSASDCGCGM